MQIYHFRFILQENNTIRPVRELNFITNEIATKTQRHEIPLNTFVGFRDLVLLWRNESNLIPNNSILLHKKHFYMPRRNFSIVVPDSTDKMLMLAAQIQQKHNQDGAASLIPATLMDTLQQLVSTARTAYERRNDLDRQKEKRNEERSLMLGLHDTQSASTPGTVRYIVTAARDILRGHFRGNERTLGDWGYVVNSPKGAVQVIIPLRANALIELAKLVMQKHYNDGSSSLLQGLDWNALNTRLYEAEQKLQEGQALNREKEKATQALHIALGTDKGQSSKTPNTIQYVVRAVRDLLLGNFRGREQELGAWGFEVNFNTSTNPPKLVNS